MSKTGTRLAAGGALALLVLVSSVVEANGRRAWRRANRAGYTSYNYGHAGYGAQSGYHGGYVAGNACGCPTGYVSSGYAQPQQNGYYQGQPQQYQGQQYQGQQYQQGQYQGQPHQQYSAGRPIYDNNNTIQPQPIPQPFHDAPPGVVNPNQQYSPSNAPNAQGGNLQGGANIQGEFQSDLPNPENQFNDAQNSLNRAPQNLNQNPIRNDGVEAPREERQQNPLEEGGSVLSE